MKCYYLTSKDGYTFDYCEESENKAMLKRYNHMIKSIRALKPIGNLDYYEENSLDLFSNVEYPCYRFTPKSQKDIDSLYDALKSEDIRLMKDIQINHIYLLYFNNDLGEFSISICDKETLDNDIKKLQELSLKLSIL